MTTQGKPEENTARNEIIIIVVSEYFNIKMYLWLSSEKLIEWKIM